MKTETQTKEEKKRQRVKRVPGRLFKRDASGKERPANHKSHSAFWIEYRVNGKRIKQRLLDDEGNPIKNRAAANKKFGEIMAPFVTENKVQRLQTIQAHLAAAEVAHAQALDEANPPLMIAHAWDAYLRNGERPDTGEATLKYYAGYWKQFGEWLGETRKDEKGNPLDTYLRDITTQTAQDYAAALIQSKISPNTYNKHTGFLRLFFHVLKDPARIVENPFDQIRKKQLKTNVRRELTIAELKAILEGATGELQTLLFIGTFTGLRLGDCCTLLWGEVDLDRGMIRRIPNKTAKSGKPVLIGIPSALAAKLAELPQSKRKGYVVPRFAALYNYRSEDGRPTRQPDISNEIQAHFAACGIQTTKEGTGKEAHEQAMKQWEEAGRKGQKPVYKRAVVQVGFHSLRHTWVSLHAAAGTPQGVIQDVIGHANPAMTAHYTHVSEDTARRTAGAWQLNEPKATRAPLPDWARKLIEGMTEKNLKTRKRQLLKE